MENSKFLSLNGKDVKDAVLNTAVVGAGYLGASSQGVVSPVSTKNEIIGAIVLFIGKLVINLFKNKKKQALTKDNDNIGLKSFASGDPVRSGGTKV